MTGTSPATTTPAANQPAAEPQTGGRKSYAKDSRLVTVQVPKFAREAAEHLEKKLDFRTRYIVAAAMQAFSQLDTNTQLDFLRDAHAKYAGAAGEPAAV